MASCSIRALVALRSTTNVLLKNLSSSRSVFGNALSQRREKRNYSIKSSTLDTPNVARLAQTARISLTPQEIEEFGPKIEQVVDWFGQLQAVDLENIEPAIRSDIVGDNLRGDVPVHFENTEAIIAAIPSYDEPYIKVPKVLNKE